MKTERLFSIVHLLLNRKQITAKELANIFEVSTRTIYRDIDSLSMSGIPIYTDKGYGGGIRLLDNYVLNKSIVSDQDINSILLGLELLEATHYNEENSALKKIQTLFNHQQEDFLEVDFSGFDDDKERLVLECLKMSLQKSFSINIFYRNSSGQVSHRKLNPLKLVFKRQNWYLVAYCHNRDQVRTFKIARILEVEATSEGFNRNDYDLSKHLLVSHGIENVQLITLRLKANALVRIREEMRFSKLIDEKNEEITLQLETEIDEWFISYVMSYADYLIDVQPKILKESIQNKAKKILSL